MQHLFVYGTLRPGGSNHALLNLPGVTVVDATAAGLALYANASGTFPYAAEQPDQHVAGTLVDVPDRAWPTLRTRLDLLEGYDPRQRDTSHYLRRRWTVRTGHGVAPDAWIYLAGPRIDLPADRHIESGDWFRHRSPLAQLTPGGPQPPLTSGRRNH